MQVSRRAINKNIEKQVFSIFYQVISDLRDPEEVRHFFEDVLTETERTALAKRLAIAHYLEKNRSYDNIKEVLKVSSATIAAVADQMGKGGRGFSVALQKIRADQWAEAWTRKIKKLTGRS